MSKFRAAPKLQSEEDFIAAAEAPRKSSKPVVTVSAVQVPAETTLVAKPVAIAVTPTHTKKAAKRVATALTDAPTTLTTSEHPWQEFDLADKAIASTQPLRLNAYQYEQLKWLATNEDRSLAQILRRLIAPALEEAVRATQD